MERLFLLCFLLLLSIQNYAQEVTKELKDSKFSLSLELSSKYMWRGLEYGDAPTVFPGINFNYKNFNAYALGAYSVNGSHQEVDLGVGYTKDWFFIGAADYYYPSAVGNKDSYFNLNNRETGHYVELYTTISPQNIPLWLTLSSYIWGADKNLDGKQAYSSYAELGYKFNFKNDNVLSLCVGAALNKSFYTDYEKGFNVVNIGLKYTTSIPLGKFNLPVSASYILNPYKEKSFITFSLYLNS